MSVWWFVVFVWCSLHVQSSPRGKYRGVHSKPGAQKKQPLAWYLEDKKDSSRAEFFVTAFVFEPRAHTGWRPCLQFAYHGLLYDAPFACYFAIAGGLDSEHL